MGVTLPKAVDTTVVERHNSKGFRVGNAEMNGWRTNMEDSHLIMIREEWAFFGIFDGHGGAACSAWVAQRIREEIEKNGCPQDDAAAKELCLKVDQAWLDTEQASGTTAAMCIVHRPASQGGKHRLHVINAGDSRVMLGKRDGSIVDGGGKVTDQGLTRDHKPDDPEEKERIYRCGGTVEHMAGNCARVNGNLAVCRGFGDRDEKQTGGPGLEDRPVTANPECGHFECDAGDILFLVCDGVSEGDFPNPEVVRFAAGLIRESDDPGAAARAVCHKAVEMKSQDNISCMIVLMDGLASAPAESPEKTVEVTPGSVLKLGNRAFRQAYEHMAERGGLTLAQAVAKRYEAVLAELAADPTPDMQEEAAFFGSPEGAAGSAEREAWLERWAQELPEEGEQGPGGMDLASLMSVMMARQGPV